MTQTFFIGVDGGATKSIVRVEDEAGNLLGRERGGPANIRLSVTQAWQSIYTALDKIISSLGVSLQDKNCRFQVGMGLAGCEVTQAYEDFLAQPHRFATIVLSSDAHTACLGAHNGKPGAIIIIGTGVVGFQIEEDQQTKVGGWGFPHDDEGGGAWLGLEAVKLTLQAVDGRLPTSGVAQAVLAHFENDFIRLVHWANQANSTAFAELAPLVIQQFQQEEPVAIELIQRAAQAVNRISDGLELARSAHDTELPCSLIGGLAPFIAPFLDTQLRSRLVPCQGSPDKGAMLLIRKHLLHSSYPEVSHG